MVVSLLGGAVWYLVSPGFISKAKAKELAAQALIGKPQFSGNVPVYVEDRGVSYAIYFTFPVPEGIQGEVYQSYAVIDKKDGEVLESGIKSPTK